MLQGLLNARCTLLTWSDLIKDWSQHKLVKIRRAEWAVSSWNLNHNHCNGMWWANASRFAECPLHLAHMIRSLIRFFSDLPRHIYPGALPLLHFVNLGLSSFGFKVITFGSDTPIRGCLRQCSSRRQPGQVIPSFKRSNFKCFAAASMQPGWAFFADSFATDSYLHSRLLLTTPTRPSKTRISRSMWQQFLLAVCGSNSSEEIHRHLI